MLQIITGHSYTRYHQHKVGRTAEAQCRFCDEDSESAWHIICECPAFEEERHNAEVSVSNLESIPDMLNENEKQRALFGPYGYLEESD